MPTYFVATTGNDLNTGTSEAAAWGTLNRVSDEFNAGRFKPGDSILLRRGNTFQNYLRLRGCSGMAGHPIIIGAYGMGSLPVVDRHNSLNLGAIWRDHADARTDYVRFEHIDFWGVKSGCIIMAHDCVGWEFHGCRIYGARRADNGDGWGGGIQVGRGRVALDRCEIFDIGGEGIYVGKGGDQSDVATLIMRSCYIHDCFGEGLDLKNGSRDCVIEHCVFRRNAIIPDAESVPLYDDRQISAGGQGHRFSDCLIESDEASGPRGAGKNKYAVALGAYAWDDSQSGLNIRFERCEIRSQRAAAAILLSGGGNSVSNCTFINCLVGIKAFSHAAIAHRIEDCGFCGTPTPVDLSGIPAERISLNRLYENGQCICQRSSSSGLSPSRG